MNHDQNPNQCRLILASGSPRRQQYFLDLGLDYTVDTPDIDEKAVEWKIPAEYALKTAYCKACAVAERWPAGTVIVAADTIVALDNTIYPKPADAEDAVRILKELSGRTHRVMTGVAVAEVGGAVQVQVASTEVRFRELSESEIRNYVATGEPLDKAGAYGIQGEGAKLVEGTQGDWHNVVGLPLNMLLTMLEKTPVPVGEAKLRLSRLDKR